MTQPVLTEANFDNEYYFQQHYDVAHHPHYAGIPNGGWLHWEDAGRGENRAARALPPGRTNPPGKPRPRISLAHRPKGYALLRGHGLEIGALHQPAQVPEHCTVEYCDAESREQNLQYFPELKREDLVEVGTLCDMDRQGLAPFADDQFDFVIFNHVIEHVANPIRALGELFRVAKPNGQVVLSVPDKDFTFDRLRQLTPFSHLLAEYQAGVTEVAEDHYRDLLVGTLPHLHHAPPEAVQAQLREYKDRREHAHVWDSASFVDFLEQSMTLLNLRAECQFSHVGRDNYFEYFSVWRKLA